MAVSKLLLERVTTALKADVARTLGAGHESTVSGFAETPHDFIDDDTQFTQRLVDEVQQYFHDTFVDTTWPACPRHPNHPLWFRDGAWRCGDERMAALGELTSGRRAG